MNIQWLLENFIVISLVPFLFTLLIYFFVSFFKVHQWRRIHIVVQWSALAYVFGVVLIVHEMYGVFILSYLLIIFILFLAIHIIIQWRKEMPISLMKAIVLLLRIVFLLFFLGYLVLLTIYAIRIFA